jgi:hypothetical protein
MSLLKTTRLFTSCLVQQTLLGFFLVVRSLKIDGDNDKFHYAFVKDVPLRTLKPHMNTAAMRTFLAFAASNQMTASGFSHLLRSLFWALETGFFKFPDASSIPTMRCAGNFT